MKKVVFALILFSLLGFLGVHAIGVGETAINVSNVVKGEPGTFIYAKDAFYVFGWASKGQYAFLIAKDTGEFVRNLHSIPGFTAQRADALTTSNFIKMIEEIGFRQITAKELPPQLVATYGSWKYFLGLVGSPNLTIILLPAGILEQDFLRHADT